MTFLRTWEKRDVTLINQPIRTDGQDQPTKDNSTSSGNTEVFFRGIKTHLIRKIQAADVVLGAVAWLTDLDILAALATKNVSVLVQKEDFLRPDKSTWRQLHTAYGKLSNGWERFWTPGISDLSCAGDPGVDGVRCVGNHNRERKPAWPRMHNKFIVFAKTPGLPPPPPPPPHAHPEKIHDNRVSFWDRTGDAGCPVCDEYYELDSNHSQTRNQFEPYAIWTGSFNFTNNSTASLENAVYIDDQKIARAYAAEWAQIFALSEPLNWQEDWCAPEYRIGT